MKLLQINDVGNYALKEKIPESDVSIGKAGSYKNLFKILSSFMLKEGGIGLSANQVNIKERVFVMKTKEDVRFFLNPEIIEATGKVKFEEGCLSFRSPRVTYKIKRKSFVKIKYYDENLELKEDSFIGVEAVCVQHEIDHLNGITMKDRHYEQQLTKRNL